MEPTDAAATVKAPVALNVLPLTVAVAVMVSVPEQPFATYVLLATPPTVVTGEVKVAVPFATHDETKLTSTGVVYALPEASTNVAVTVVVPPADNDEVPMDKVPAEKLDPVPLPILTVEDEVPPVELLDPPELELDVEPEKAPLPPQPAMIAITRSMAILLIIRFILPKASSKGPGWNG